MFSLRLYQRLYVSLLQTPNVATSNGLGRQICTALIYKTKPCITQNSLTPIMNSLSTRYYAKGKDKKKEKGKKKVEINETQLSEVINVDTLKTQMQKPIETLKQEFIKNLSLRSTTGSIESIEVNFDGKDYVLQELAQIVRKNPNLLIINMSTFPQALPAVLKTIEKSGMNLNPQQDGTTIYIPVPKVTKEYRENLAKNAKVLFTKCRDNIRDAQNKFIKNLKRQNNLSEDLVHSVQEQIIFIGDQHINEANNMLTNKLNELLGKE